MTLLNRTGIRNAVIHAKRVIHQYLEMPLDHHRLHAVFDRRFGFDLNHALRPAGGAKPTVQGHGAEQEMGLLFTRVQWHHEALHTLGALVQGHLAGIEHRQNAAFDGFGFDVGQHIPRQHVGACWQGCKRAVWAVDTRARTRYARHRRTELRACRHHRRAAGNS